MALFPRRELSFRSRILNYVNYTKSEKVDVLQDAADTKEPKPILQATAHRVLDKYLYFGISIVFIVGPGSK